MSFFLTLFSLIPFYLIGATPTGYLLAKRRGVNIYEQGSGSVGATNVGRVLGKGAAVTTLAVDIFKGFITVWLASLLSGDEPLYTAGAGVAVTAGHCFSIPGKLKGGKGVATAFGVFLYLSMASASFGIGMFAVMMVVFQTVSLASITAALMIPLYALLTDTPNMTCAGMVVIALLIVFRHKENLERLIMGTEKKFRFKRSPHQDKADQKETAQ